MNTLTPMYFTINHSAAVSAKKTSPMLPTALSIKEIERLQTYQKIQRDYEEAHISQGFWSTLNRFLKLKGVARRATRAQQRLDMLKQQLADQDMRSHRDYTRLLGELALLSTQQQIDWQ